MKRPLSLVFVLACTMPYISWADANDPVAVQRIWYVDDDAPGAIHDGTRWETAFVYLQDALAVAEPDQVIRVAQGIYKPDQGANEPPGNREATFQLISGVTLAGGYAGPGVLDANGAPIDPNTRNIDLLETILSGDLNGDDSEVTDPCDLLHEATRAENSRHVVVSYENDETAVVDGFTITGGHANDTSSDVTPAGSRGGGMYNYHSYLTVSNCTFNRNAGIWGGGMYNDESNSTVNNCTFIENAAMYSSGMHNSRGTPKILDCSFIGGQASGAYGGMGNGHSSPTIMNCIFRNNQTDGSGGGIRNYKSDPHITNCCFIDNKAGGSGGGMEDEDSSSIVTNCTFSGNKAERNGGGIWIEVSDTTVINCILWGNEPDAISDWLRNPDNTTVVTYSNVQGSWRGLGNINIDPRFVRGPLGDYYLSQRSAGQWWDSPCVDAGSDTASNLDLDERTTRTDQVGDQGAVDTGYHYPQWVSSGLEYDQGTEGFESGDLNHLRWELSGDAHWMVCSDERNSGRYSARAGWIFDGERSVLSIERDCVSGDLSFHCRVSSEAGYDCLTFYIDGTEKGKWSGEQDWTKVSFPVTAGTRTFEWVYAKDGSGSRGSDTAWLDDIAFPVN